MRAVDRCPDIKTLCLAGGVAANSHLRHKFSAFAQGRGFKFLAPAQNYCGDNAAMIAYSGVQWAKKGLMSSMDFEAVPRGKIVPDDFIVNPFFKE
jgi:N6-L-threonylcarbamoyladenine synthase